MKKTAFLIAMAIVVASCGALKGTSSQTSSSSAASSTQSSSASAVASSALANNSTAISAGKNAGSALLAMYNQYKADGNKYDYKNLNNIINTLQLVSACEGLKENKANKEYKKEFGKGMIASALGLVTESNVNTVTNTLTDMVVNNPTVTSAATTAADKLNTAAQTASSISSILSLFAGK